MAILGELPAESGTVNTVGRVAYVSQEAWIFNGSLKNNITFGQEFDEKKYKRVIEICALERVSYSIALICQNVFRWIGNNAICVFPPSEWQHL